MNTYIPPMLTIQRSFFFKKKQTSVKNVLNDIETFFELFWTTP